MEILVGTEYILKGKRVKCTARWAQGIYNTYHFDDGFHFNGDPEILFKNGDLKLAGPGPGKVVDTVANPDWKRAKAVPQIVDTPTWLRKDVEEKDGKTPKS